MRPTPKNVNPEMLRVRYAELLRLREYVQRLESSREEEDQPREALAVFKRHGLANGPRAWLASSSAPWRIATDQVCSS